jgi:hypothetical protein
MFLVLVSRTPETNSSKSDSFVCFEVQKHLLAPNQTAGHHFDFHQCDESITIVYRSKAQNTKFELGFSSDEMLPSLLGFFSM